MRHDAATTSALMMGHSSIGIERASVSGMRTECRDRVSPDAPRMAAASPAIQPLDGRQAVIVDPSEIRPGDWMRDLGRLRHVESVETTDGPIIPGTLVRFSDDTDGQYSTLGIPGTVAVTIWRRT